MSFPHTLFVRLMDHEDDTLGIRILRVLLWMPAWIFGLMARWRNWMYEVGWLKMERLPVPVISVGGVTVGGAGKTPVVRYLAELLKDMGYRPVILSRGYGRGGRHVTPVSLQESWHRVGDEPFFLASILSDVPVVVGADRLAAGRRAVAEFQPDVLILDDGFQHRHLHRDLDIVVYDSTGYHHNLSLMPAGPLRESMSALRRARSLILTRTDQTEGVTRLAEHARGMNPDIQIIESVYRPIRLRRRSDNMVVPLDHLKNQPVLILCGIANPVSLGRTISDLGAHVVSTFSFADHHAFSITDMDHTLQSAQRVEARWILTTEKDAVRIPNHPIQSDLLVLDITLFLPAGETILKNLILSLDIPK